MVSTLMREPRQRRRWGQVVARAWDDNGFRQRLLAEPEAVLRAEGFEVPAGSAIRVYEGETGEGAEAGYLWLPARPADEELVEDDLSVSCVQQCLCVNCGYCICRSVPTELCASGVAAPSSLTECR